MKSASQISNAFWGLSESRVGKDYSPLQQLNISAGLHTQRCQALKKQV